MIRIWIIGLAAIFTVGSIAAQNMAPEDADAWTESIARWSAAPHGEGAKAKLFPFELKQELKPGSMITAIAKAR